MLHTVYLVFVLFRSLLDSLFVVAQRCLKLIYVFLEFDLDFLEIHVRIIRELLLQEIQESVVF